MPGLSAVEAVDGRDPTLFYCTTRAIWQIDRCDAIRSQAGGLHRRDGTPQDRLGRSDRHIAAIQHRRQIWQLFRQTGSHVIPEVVRRVGDRSSPSHEAEWIILPEHRQRSIKPDAATRTGNGLS